MRIGAAEACMEVEYYAHLYRRYGLYARDYGENKLYRIACGPRNDDYHWTEVMMAKAGDPTMLNGPYMDGLALHYYTAIKRLPDGNRVGSATEFDEAQWIEIIGESGFSWTSLAMPRHHHGQYDPEKQVAMIIDEWGTPVCRRTGDSAHAFSISRIRCAMRWWRPPRLTSSIITVIGCAWQISRRPSTSSRP
ncbi:MAG: hypothetical protein R2932_03920 [Caldilineaceae bacterium]